MKRMGGKRRSKRFSGAGVIIAGWLGSMPAVGHAQTPPPPEPAASSAPAAPAPPPAPPPPPHPAASARPNPYTPPPRAYPPPPPRGYPPPPPRAPGYQQGYGQPGYGQQGYGPGYGGVNQGRPNYGYYVPPQELRAGVYRPFSFTFSVGPGKLIGPGENELAVTYNLFRLGFGIAPNLSFVLSFEGAGTNSVNPATGDDSWLKQETFLLGLQYHLERGFYLRGAVGQGSVSETTDFEKFNGGSGVALSGAVGFEFVQTAHFALALDLNASTTRYARESWQTAGLNLALSFF